MAASPFQRVLPGQVIPPFTLRSTSGRPVSASDFRGRWLVLGFLGPTQPDPPGPVLPELQAVYPRLLANGARVLAIVPEPVDLASVLPPGHPPFDLLIDLDAKVHRAYGAVAWSGAPAPAVFLADPAGRVLYRALLGLGETWSSAENLLAILNSDRLNPK
jgi:peroxiredoxin